MVWDPNNHQRFKRKSAFSANVAEGVTGDRTREPSPVTGSEMSFSKNYSSEDTSADAADSEVTTSSHSGSSRFILLFSSHLPHP